VSKGKRELGMPIEAKRNYIWRHNSFFGFARMMHAQCETLIKAESTTPEAKATALRIKNEVHVLIRQLKTRVDK
jgi:hypothetical protein